MAGPEKKFRAGAVTATVWANKRTFNGKESVVLSATIERSYMDKDKKWQTTNSFDSKDLPKLALVANEAYKYIAMKSEHEEED